MANDSESVIVQDPDILSGPPVFRGTRPFPRPFSTTWRAEIPWMNSWNNTLVLPVSRLSPR
jgi:hypothetical protein